MFQSKLKLNPSNTEFLLIASKSQREKFNNLFPLAVLDNEMNSADSVRNLGVFFGSGLNFCQHIFCQVSSSCFYHIRDLKRIRKSLHLALAKQIALALVTSKLDYCNSLYYTKFQLYGSTKILAFSELSGKGWDKDSLFQSLYSSIEIITLASNQI